MQLINNTRLRFGWATAGGLAAFMICAPLSLSLMVLFEDRTDTGGQPIGCFPPFPQGTPFHGAAWLYYLCTTLYCLGLGGLLFGVIIGSFRKKPGATLPGGHARPVTRWNARLTVPSTIVLCLVPVAFMFIWNGGIAPHLFAWLKPLQESRPFLHDILEALAAVLVLPWTFAGVLGALYVYQRRWDRLHNRPNGSGEPPPGAK